MFCGEIFWNRVLHRNRAHATDFSFKNVLILNGWRFPESIELDSNFNSVVVFTLESINCASEYWPITIYTFQSERAGKSMSDIRWARSLRVIMPTKRAGIIDISLPSVIKSKPGYPLVDRSTQRPVLSVSRKPLSRNCLLGRTVSWTGFASQRLVTATKSLRNQNRLSRTRHGREWSRPGYLRSPRQTTLFGAALGFAREIDTWPIFELWVLRYGPHRWPRLGPIGSSDLNFLSFALNVGNVHTHTHIHNIYAGITIVVISKRGSGCWWKIVW